jgi:cyanophycinase
VAGPLALVGSGEFLEEMEAIDRVLLAATMRADGPAVIVPTASAQEPGMPETWAERGIRHFMDRLGVRAEAALVLDRAGAGERLVPLVTGARFIYFSGGNPRYLTETLAGTPFWAATLAAWQGGAALAGCSAGAMMLGAAIQSIVGRSGDTVRGLGIVPGVSVIPHFDRIETYRPGAVAALREARTPDITLLGIDERTALVHIGGSWRVKGAGGVTVMADDGEQTYAADSTPPLPAPAGEA